MEDHETAPKDHSSMEIARIGKGDAEMQRASPNRLPSKCGRLFCGLPLVLRKQVLKMASSPDDLRRERERERIERAVAVI
jgi:hypothetical protein